LSSNWPKFILLLERCRAIIKLCRADFSSNRNSSSSPCPAHWCSTNVLEISQLSFYYVIGPWPVNVEFQVLVIFLQLDNRFVVFNISDKWVKWPLVWFMAQSVFRKYRQILMYNLKESTFYILSGSTLHNIFVEFLSRLLNH
jgi:hypothetical protein